MHAVAKHSNLTFDFFIAIDLQMPIAECRSVGILLLSPTLEYAARTFLFRSRRALRLLRSLSVC